MICKAMENANRGKSLKCKQAKIELLQNTEVLITDLKKKHFLFTSKSIISKNERSWL